MEDLKLFDKYCEIEYRKDIQGLRALGAVIIMVFHIWLNKVSGGVDVFFVVSGFLMSSLMLKEFFKNGVENPLPFWGGVVKRVFPSAYLVLGATLVASYFLLSPSFLMGSITEVITSALNIENIQLMRKSVDYLASDEPSSPVQQFWALSIQIQFYIVLPFILIPLAKTSKKIGSSMPLYYGISAIFLLSFIYALFSVSNNPVISYFNPMSRAWEFLFGSLVFLLLSNIKLVKYRSILGFLGIFLIIGGAFFIPRGAKFPGIVSLIPVVGATFIIISGFGGSGFINKFLSNHLMVFLGGISFTIYLWHWPILIFYKEIFNTNTVGFAQGTAIMLLAVILAIITSKIIEAPFRKISRERVLLNFSIGAFCFFPVIVSAFMVRSHISSIGHEVSMRWMESDVKSYNGNGVSLESVSIEIDRNELLAARSVLPEPYNSGCHQNGDDSEVKKCRFGEIGSDTKIVLAGGSHATQWLPALKVIGEDNNIEIISMTKSSCPLGGIKDSNDSCYEWSENVLNEIARMQPFAVITNSTRTGTKEEYIPNSYVDSWSFLSSKNIKVVGIRDNPRFPFDVPDCLYNHKISLDASTCSIDRNGTLQAKSPAEKHVNLISNIDMSDMLCTKDVCLAHFNGYLMYRDSHHIHLPYVKFLKGKLEENLKNILPELF